jgi:hypothetical protein
VRQELEHHHIITHLSWLSASELLAANLDQPLSCEYAVDVQAYRDFLKCGRPSDWSSAPLKSGAHTVSNEEMRKVIEWWKPGGELYYTWIQWSQPLRDYCGPFLDFVELLRKAGDPSHLRVTFGYDYV